MFSTGYLDPFAPRTLHALLHYYESICPCALQCIRLAVSAACTFHFENSCIHTSALTILPQNDRFTCSTSKPDYESCRLYAGHHLDNMRTLSRLLPGQARSWFAMSFTLFDTSSNGLLSFISRSPTFLQRLPPRLFTSAACKCLVPPSAGRRRRVCLHLQCSTV